jgi:prevent-host-death family protein
MEKTVNIHTAKTTLSKLVAEAEQGETIFIARAGKTVAKLTAARSRKSAKPKPKVDRKSGFMKGQIWIGPDFDDPLPDDIMKAFRGEGD